MKHTAPCKERDVKILTDAYIVAKHHLFIPGCRVASKQDQYQDFVNNGVEALALKSVIKKWSDGRSYDRAPDENWN